MWKFNVRTDLTETVYEDRQYPLYKTTGSRRNITALAGSSTLVFAMFFFFGGGGNWFYPGAVCEVAANPTGGMTVLTQEALSAATGDDLAACISFRLSVKLQATFGQETKPSAN